MSDSGAARKFLKELLAGNFLFIVYFSLDNLKIIVEVIQITLYIAV